MVTQGSARELKGKYSVRVAARKLTCRAQGGAVVQPVAVPRRYPGRSRGRPEQRADHRTAMPVVPAQVRVGDDARLEVVRIFPREILLQVILSVMAAARKKRLDEHPAALEIQRVLARAQNLVIMNPAQPCQLAGQAGVAFGIHRLKPSMSVRPFRNSDRGGRSAVFPLVGRPHPRGGTPARRVPWRAAIGGLRARRLRDFQMLAHGLQTGLRIPTPVRWSP